MTNDEYIKAIDMRTSRRTYKPHFMGKGYMEVVSDMVAHINEHTGLELVFFADGTAPFTVFGGQFSLIALCGDDTEKARIDCGYYGEAIVLQCVYHGLGTCWVTGSYNENKLEKMLNLPKGRRVFGVITVGEVSENKSIKEKILHNITHKESKTYDKMFSALDNRLPDEFEFAMKMVEKTPSATNRQCINFKYENGIVSASVDEPYSDKSLDLGIAQLHFQLGAAQKGINGKWNIKGEFITE